MENCEGTIDLRNGASRGCKFLCSDIHKGVVGSSDDGRVDYEDAGGFGLGVDVGDAADEAFGAVRVEKNECV